MLRQVLLRVLSALPVFLVVTAVVFGSVRLAPGDAAAVLAPDNATEEQVEAIRERWGLNHNVFVQYLIFLKNAAQMDFGESYRYGQPVSKLVWQRFPATAELALVTMILAIGLAVPLGVCASLLRGTLFDRVVLLGTTVGISFPGFWLGSMLVLLLCVQLGLFPAGGRLPSSYGAQSEGFVIFGSLVAGDLSRLAAALHYIALPALTLAMGFVGLLTRIVRNSVTEVSNMEFVKTSVTKGMTPSSIFMRDILPNASIPLLTVAGMEIGLLLSGTIVIEVVFSWPGLGTLLLQAINVRDVSLVTAIVLFYTTIFVLINIALDVAYAIIDPRISR